MKGGVFGSDSGTEFTNRDFQKALDSFDISHKVKGNGEVNAIAVLDSATGQVRRDAKARSIDNPEQTWSAVLGAAITAHNTRINTTMRDSPSGVGKEGHEELWFLQTSDNAERYAHNSRLASCNATLVLLPHHGPQLAPRTPTAPAGLAGP